MACDTFASVSWEVRENFEHVNLFQSESPTDFQTSILVRRDSYFGEIVGSWLALVTGSHGWRAQILSRAFPPKLEFASDD